MSCTMFPRNNPQKQGPILAFGDWIVNVYFQIFSSLFHKNTKGWPDLRLANLVDVSPALWSLWSEARLQGSMAEMQELRSSAEEFPSKIRVEPFVFVAWWQDSYEESIWLLRQWMFSCRLYSSKVYWYWMYLLKPQIAICPIDSIWTLKL